MRLSVRAAAAEAGDRPALVTPSGVLGWSEVAERAATAAAALAGRALPPRRGRETTPVAVVGSSDVETIVLLLALFELGIPVLLVHPRLTEGEQNELLEATGGPPLVDPAEPSAEARSGGGWPEHVAAAPEGPLAIVPTSGSSGRPKAVVLSRRAFLAAADASAANLGWRREDRWLLALPLAHVGGLSILVRCLAARRAVVLAEPPLGAAATVETARRERVTLLSLVPTQLRRLLAAGLPPPPALRAVLLGGAAASPELLAAAADAGWPVLATYGLTETCSQVATQPYGTTQRGELGCGPPVAGMEVRIGAGGGIEVRGRSLMSGYLPAGAPPWSADGWLATGDLGRLDAAGNLHVLGRRDDVVVTGGENVHPLEVEAALEGHPGIAEAGVFGVADAEWGEVVAGALVARGAPLDDPELRAWLRPRLAGYKTPRRLAWVAALPRLATGKLDRRALAAASVAALRPLRD